MGKPKGANLSFTQLVEAMNYKLEHDGRSLLPSIPTIDAIVHKLHKTIALLQGHRNTFLPIHRIPPELLAEVFALTLPQRLSFIPYVDRAKRDERQKNFTSLLHVCRHWRGVVANTRSSLWSVIESYPNARTELHLRRSKNAPLSIYLGDSEEGPTTESLLVTILRHSSRIQEFHCLLPGHIFSELSSPALFDVPMPCIESLTITQLPGQNIDDEMLPPIFQGHMPKLKKLCISFYTSWPVGYFAGLTHLCLHDQGPISPPAMSAFLDFLDTCPALEKLVMVNAGPDIDDLLSDRRVDLFRLRRLELGEWGSSIPMSQFLSYLIIPASASLYIWGIADLWHSDTESNPAAVLLPQDLSQLANLETVLHVELLRGTAPVPRSRFYHFYIDHGTLQMCGPFSPAKISRFLHRLSWGKVQTLTVYDALLPEMIPSETWSHIFSLSHKLETLDIRSYLPDATRIIRSFLSALRLTNKAPLPAPNLKNLRFHVKGNIPQLTVNSFLMERADSGNSLERIDVHIVTSTTGGSNANSPITTRSGLLFDLRGQEYGWAGVGRHYAAIRSRSRYLRPTTPQEPGGEPLREEDIACLERYLNGNVQVTMDHDDRDFPKVMTLMWESPALKRTRSWYDLCVDGALN